jgi:hypothetical protein
LPPNVLATVAATAAGYTGDRRSGDQRSKQEGSTSTPMAPLAGPSVLDDAGVDLRDGRRRGDGRSLNSHGNVLL